MNKIKVILLLLPFLCLCGWAMCYANFVKHAQMVTLPITGYDPRNLLSGHYIEFRIDWKNANCHQLDWNGSCPRKDFEGITRYYVPESEARKLERVINNSNHRTEIVFAYKKDSIISPKPQELQIDGQMWYKHQF